MQCLVPNKDGTRCASTSRTLGQCHSHYQAMRNRARKIKATAIEKGADGDKAERRYMAGLRERGLICDGGSTPADDHGALDAGSKRIGYGRAFATPQRSGAEADKRVRVRPTAVSKADHYCPCTCAMCQDGPCCLCGASRP